MSDIQVDSGRRGGREARRALRAAPLPERAAGLAGHEGGHYKALKDEDIQKIHQAVLDVLEQVGLADAIPSGIEAMTGPAPIQRIKGRLTFPRALVEDTIAKAARQFVAATARTRSHDMEPWGKKVYFGTAGAAVHIVDPITGEYRESTTKDLYDIARIVDEMEHIHFFQRAVVLPRPARSVRDGFQHLLCQRDGHHQACGLELGRSPSISKPRSQMLHMIAGGEDKWRARPFVSQSNCFVVPPLKFAQDACRCLELAVEGGMPVLLLSAAQAGATSPAALAGTIVQAVAEVPRRPRSM